MPSLGEVKRPWRRRRRNRRNNKRFGAWSDLMSKWTCWMMVGCWHFEDFSWWWALLMFRFKE
jgi:hypothetical protein